MMDVRPDETRSYRCLLKTVHLDDSGTNGNSLQGKGQLPPGNPEGGGRLWLLSGGALS